MEIGIPQGNIFPQGISDSKIFPQDFPTRFPTRFSHKIFLQDFPQDFPTRFSCKNFLQHFSTRISHKIFLQHFPTRISHKIFPQDFSVRFSHKIFPQDFLKLDPDWLAPHHPIPNAKFPPITALLNRPTYHKRSKVSPPPFPQILWEPKSMNKLTLNEPAIRIAISGYLCFTRRQISGDRRLTDLSLFIHPSVYPSVCLSVYFSTFFLSFCSRG